MWLAARVRRRFAGPGTRPCGGPATVDLVFGQGDNRRRVWRRSSPGAASEKMPLRLVLGPEGGRGAGASRRVEPTRVFRSRARDELGRRSGGGSAAAGTRSCGKGPSARPTDGSRSSTGSRSSRTGSQRPYFLTRVGLLLEGALESGRATDAACAAPEIVQPAQLVAPVLGLATTLIQPLPLLCWTTHSGSEYRHPELGIAATLPTTRSGAASFPAAHEVRASPMEAHAKCVSAAVVAS
jgi:hypothetical protein